MLSNAKGKRSSHINPNLVKNSISESERNVNKNSDEKFSIGGLKAETADKTMLENAMELEKGGVDSEQIRKNTGWFKGYDGKWRFAIDDTLNDWIEDKSLPKIAVKQRLPLIWQPF